MALIALTALATLGMPTAASADEADCDGNGFTGGSASATYFQPEAALLPPALLRSGFDCAIKAGPEPFDQRLQADGTYLTSVSFRLIYVDFTIEDLVALFRDLEEEGWADGRQINLVFDADGGDDQLSGIGADELAALDPAPGYVGARFSNGPDVPPPSTLGRNIYELTWTNGSELYQSPTGILDRPILEADIILTEPFRVAPGLDDPSTLSELRTIQDAAPTGVQWAVIGTGSLMLMLVVGWPSTLLNSVVGSRYQQLQRWFRGLFSRRKEAPPAPDGTIRRSRLPGWLMWPGFALAAILGAFVDPDFGFNLMSLRLVVTLFLSFLLFNLAAWAIVRRVAVRLQPDADPYLRFRWGSLVLVIAAVIIARVLGLEPGVIFGLVAGIAYATTLQAAKSAVVTIVGSAFGLALAIVAWIGYSVLAPVPVDHAAYVFLVEFLAGVTVKGVSSLPLSLLPLGNLDGAKLFGWRRLVWGASYVAGLAAFMVVLLTIPKSWGAIPGDFLRWLIVFGVYALLALVVWAVNARLLRRNPLPPEKEQGDQPDAITLD